MILFEAEAVRPKIVTQLVNCSSPDDYGCDPRLFEAPAQGDLGWTVADFFQISLVSSLSSIKKNIL